MTEDVTTVPDPLEWFEGMLLAPQHFQHLSERLDALPAYLVGRTAPFAYGVTALDDNTGSDHGLAGTVYAVERIEAVMPDGLVVRHPRRVEAEGADDSLVIDLKEARKAKKIDADAPSTVYLCVPRILDRTDSEARLSDRFDAHEVVLDDITGTGFTTPVRQLRPRLHLDIDPIDDGKVVALPLARFVPLHGRFQWGRFVPPHLRVSPDGGAGPLYRRLDRLAEVIRNDKLPIFARTRTATARMAMQALFSSLPALEAQIQARASHPFAVYQEVCRLFGNMAALGASLPAPLTGYDHDDAYTAFDEALTVIEDHLDGIKESFGMEPFALHRDSGVWYLRLRAAWLPKGENTALYLGVRESESLRGRDLDRWVDEARVVSEDRAEALHDTREVGARRAPVDDPRAVGLLVGQGVRVYRVEVDPDYIEADAPLFVIPSEPADDRRPREIVLYIPADDDARGGGR